MEVSSQFHAPAALLPGETARYPWYRRLGGLQSRSGRYQEDKNLYRESNEGFSVVQPVA
jgi:hypothetical protein